MARHYRWEEYQFEIHPHYTENWPNTGGVYVFAKPIPGVLDAIIFPEHATWKATYIGRAKSFSTRTHDNHGKWMDALDLGFTHVHILPVSEKKERRRIETQLIKTYKPPLNIQGK